MYDIWTKFFVNRYITASLTKADKIPFSSVPHSEAEPLLTCRKIGRD